MTYKNSNDRRSLALHIYDAMKLQIAEGSYPPGTHLPSTRHLASELGVSRATVVAAYEQLLAEGYLETHQGSRARVVGGALPSPARSIATAKTEPRLSRYGSRLVAGPLPGKRFSIADFRYGDMASCDFPMLGWKRAVNAALLARVERLRYGDPAGSPTLRQALQGYLWRARGIHCKLEQIIIVNGSQQGLDLCSRLFLEPGAKAVIEDPCYGLARQAFLAVGADICAIPVDREGLQTKYLASIDNAQLAYLTPSHQFPLGSVMSVTRRYEFLSWAEHVGAYVVEDDYDCEYRYDTKPIQALQTLGSPDNIIYLGTVSKTLSPLLRLGYLVVPANLIGPFSNAKRLADRETPRLEQEALAKFIESGAYERHVSQARRKNSQRRQVLLELLTRTLGDRIAIEGSAAGLHVVIWLNELPASMEGEFITKAAAAGVGIYPITPFYASPDHRSGCAGIVLGYAGVCEKEITQGVLCLVNVLNQLTP